MVFSGRLINKLKNVCSFCQRYSQMPLSVQHKALEIEELSLIRNIGIFAHIDAGKTTTTERMLFYSGMIRNMGEVHHGNTVTDFMDQERERGITITAASVTFPWKKHKINLLDTPGHIDFTMEVEQTLSVLDGAVVVLDGSAGVEAQTLTVWGQSNRYKVPRIVYINKMDKSNADFFQSVKSVEEKLDTIPLVTQLPLFDEKKNFKGIIDVIMLQKLEWNVLEKETTFKKSNLGPNDGKIYEEAKEARVKLTDKLTEIDTHLAELIINEDIPFETVSVLQLRNSLKKAMLSELGTPILCGSSYKNIGVHQLMDGIIHYLPSPLNDKTSLISECFGGKLCARAFKVRHDRKRGAITFFRVYSGNINKNQKIYNMRLEVSETCGKLLVANADDYEEVDEITSGNIAAVTGLRSTRIGDLVTSSSSAFASAKEKLQSKKQCTTKDANNMFAVGTKVPDPVFFCSIEAPSLSFQSALDVALMELEREDPSLKVTINRDTGQTVLAGMGELHIEIIKERIRSEYKVDADTGALQIAYREELINAGKASFSIDQVIGSKKNKANITLSVFPVDEMDGDILLLDRSPDSVENISAIYPSQLLAVKHGVESALSSGPRLMCPVVNAKVKLHWLDVGKGSSDSGIASVASQCVKKALIEGGTRLLEPIMKMEILCVPDDLDKVIQDLARRRSDVSSVNNRGLFKIVVATSPLSELLGYSNHLRNLTSGRSTYSMEFHKFETMSPAAEIEAIKSATGFYPM